MPREVTVVVLTLRRTLCRKTLRFLVCITSPEFLVGVRRSKQVQKTGNPSGRPAAFEASAKEQLTVEVGSDPSAQSVEFRECRDRQGMRHRMTRIAIQLVVSFKL